MIRLRMRRLFQSLLAVWLAIAMGMAQSCMEPAQNLSPPTQQPSSPIGGASSGGATAQRDYDSLPSASAANDDTHIDTTGYNLDQSESKALTEYLTQHKLPLVSAQVLNGPASKRAVVLYGFVGSDFGHSDAAAKARRYLGDQSITVDNRVKVRPELLASNSASAAAGGAVATPDDSEHSTDSSYPGVQSYVDQQNRAQAQNQGIPLYQGSGSSMGGALPLIMMLAILSMGMSGGNVSLGPGSTGSPFGNTPYNPYSGYPPPYGGSPYSGSPYGGSPYGSSPFGGSPFGSSPFGGSPFGGSPFGPSPNYP